MPKETTNKPHSSDILHLSIEKLVHGGNGLAFHDNQACFVGDVIDGEKIAAVIKKRKKQFLEASLLEVTKSSPFRTRAACKLFHECGGCQWQHITYEHQLLCKTGIVQDCLKRIGKINAFEIRDVHPSPSVFNYRFRTNLKVRYKRNPAIGFFKKNSHTIIPVGTCPILAEPLNSALHACNDLMQQKPELFIGVGEIRMVYVQAAEAVLVTFASNSSPVGKFRYSLKKRSFVSSYYTTHEQVLGLQFKRSTESFYQVNFHQNENLIRHVRSCFGPGIDSVLDIYCGCGNFSLFMAQDGRSVTGIESNHAAVKEAKYNARLNTLKGCSFKTGSASETAALTNSRLYNGILINPPRTGCDRETLNAIITIKPQEIVYVSCNPATLARDLNALLQTGYCIEDITLFDMFPQTYHVETVVKLTR